VLAYIVYLLGAQANPATELHSITRKCHIFSYTYGGIGDKHAEQPIRQL